MPALARSLARVYAHDRGEAARVTVPADGLDLVREDLRFRTAPSARGAEVLERIESTESVSLHVRRTDFLHVAGGTLNICSPAYYRACVELIQQRVEDPWFFVFSDDIAWCRENLDVGIRVRGAR